MLYDLYHNQSSPIGYMHCRINCMHPENETSLPFTRSLVPLLFEKRKKQKQNKNKNKSKTKQNKTNKQTKTKTGPPGQLYRALTGPARILLVSLASVALELKYQVSTFIYHTS